MIIGVDFDNTIVSYDRLMHSIARQWGLIDAATAENKRQIRDAVRALPDGEIAWQRLQIAAYGTRISEALPAEGVTHFFERCKAMEVPVRIVSHKTVYPNLGEPRVNLRDAALGWLELHGFLRTDRLGVAIGDVYFESTRAGKIARITQLGVTHFIDDLEETFNESDFPRNVEKILYSGDAPANPGDAKWMPTWAGIEAHVWPDARTAQCARGEAR